MKKFSKLKSLAISISIHFFIVLVLIGYNSKTIVLSEIPENSVISFVTINNSEEKTEVKQESLPVAKVVKKAEFSEKSIISQNVKESASTGTPSNSSPEYSNVVLAKLEQVKRYPSQALKRRLEGNLVLNLKIDGNGGVLNYQVVHSSGYEQFDKEALKMVERAAPFPSSNGSIQEYQIPISFQLS